MNKGVEREGNESEEKEEKGGYVGIGRGGRNSG